MSTPWSATQVAFIAIAVIQAVFALIWGYGAWWAQSTRSAIAHWAAWALLSSLTWVILSASFESPPLVGVLAGVLGAICLQRGIRLFIEASIGYRVHAALLLAIVAASWLHESDRHLQAAINFGVLTAIFISIAVDLHLHARDQMRMRWPIVLSLPLLLGAVGYGSRVVRALIDPASVLSEMAADSSLNVGGAIAYIVLVLAFHAMLMTLVVSRLFNELRKLSLHDALTGLLNRRAMEETLQTRMRSSRRSGEAFVVMMLDLDYFKRINDDFGHAVGDLALKHVSQLLQGALRDIDHLARFGGEEFVVLMPAATLAQAHPVAERLRQMLAANPLKHNSLAVNLSVSIGVAEWRGPDDDSPELLRRADAALFQAKVQGRNRVVTAAPEKIAIAV
jgi:diguanylate cyclase (GGDEF)-like protein